jgi:hypothetical protein
VAVDHDVGTGFPAISRKNFLPLLVPVEVVLPGRGVEEQDFFPQRGEMLKSFRNS